MKICVIFPSMTQAGSSLFMIIILFVCFAANGQNPRIDSLKLLITSLPEDSTRVNALNELADILKTELPMQAIQYAEVAKNLAQTLNYQLGIGYAQKTIGMAYRNSGDYQKVFDYYGESLKTFESINDTLGIANMLNNLGVFHFDQGAYDKAITYYLQSLHLSELIGDPLRIATAMVNVGAVYGNQVNTYRTAIPYYQNALSMGYELADNAIIGTCTDNLGDIYLKIGQYDSAQYYLEKSLEANANTIYLPYSLNLLGEVLGKEGKYDEAIKYQTQAYELAKQQDAKPEMAQTLVGLGNSRKEKRELANALDNYKQAESLAHEIGARAVLKDVYNGLAETNSLLGNYKEAFEYRTLFAAIKDTLFNTDTDKKIRTVQFTYEIDKKQGQIDAITSKNKLQELELQQTRFVTYAAVFAGIVLLVLAGGMFNRYRFIRRTNKIIEQEKIRSDKLLLNILPVETAEELKEKGTAQARSYSNVTILFTDFKGFTELSATLSPPALVKEIHYCYMAFDEIMVRHGVEKIKTIGDAYMAAGGLPKPNDSHAVDVTLAAIEIRDFMDKLIKQRKQVGKPYFEIRIGIHTGPVVAGVVGIHKFAYDIWGDAVNIASRMESNSQPGKINISSATYDLIKDRFQCTPRGEISVKGAGEKTMYFVEHELVRESSVA
jgi:adenylate cyclase